MFTQLLIMANMLMNATTFPKAKSIDPRIQAHLRSS